MLSSGKYRLSNQKKCHTCYIPVNLKTRSILSKLTNYVPLAKKPNFVTSLASHEAQGGGWLRYCAITCNVVGLITEGVTGIFRCYNISGRNMVLGSNQALTEMSTRNTSLGVKCAGV
jgi:hypothetical protein